MKRLIFFIIALVIVFGFSFLPAMASPGAEVAISIEPPEVNFGSVVPAIGASGDIITIANIGNVTIKVTAEIIDDTGGFYGRYLKLNNIPSSEEDKWASLGFDALGIGNNASVTTKLEEVPSSLSPGSYTCTVIFWAEVQ